MIWQLFLCNEMEKRTELLAPAGNMECFYAAMSAGADAVYAGGMRFGARAYAGNFSEEELIRAIDYAHLFGKKMYLTLNTLTKESEMHDLPEFLKPLYEAGLDGVIVQDLGIFKHLRENFPLLPLHASTQMALTGVYGAELIKSLGAVRIVPARELSVGEIREIHEKTGMEIECFIHGAMCYCYSGMCLMSSMLGGRSGNRGRCAGPCRQPYGGKGSDKYPLSMKDLSSIMQLPDMIEAGVDSMKIEGRMKAPEYVAGVTAIYRKYLDLYYEKGREGFKVDKKDEEELLSLYSRSGLNPGYFNRHNGQEMITMRRGSYSRALPDDSEVKIMQLPVRGKAVVREGEPLILEIEALSYHEDGSSDRITVTEKGAPAESAKNRPMEEKQIRKQLNKTGGSNFVFDSLEISVSGNVFIPVSALNDLRRQAFGKLAKELLSEFKRTL